MSLELTDNHYCYVCGKDNPHGFKLDFDHPETGRLTAAVVFKKEHQGYQGIVHGGLMATLLDEMMVNLAWKEDKPAVTGEITVRLKKTAKVGEKIFLEGRLDRETGKILYASATAKDASGEVLATATASCVRIQKVG